MILRRLARPMLAATFVYGGINALRQLEGHVQAAKPLLDKTIGKRADQIPDKVPTDAETLVKIDAGVKIGAGLALALGKAPRLAALLLVGSLAATTAATHRFWEETEPEQRDAQLVHFLKNCGLAGGLLLAAADTHGKPSAAWLARHGAHMAGRRLGSAGHAAELFAEQSMRHKATHAKHRLKHAKHAAKHAKLSAGKAGMGARKSQHDGMHMVRKTFGKSRKSGLQKFQATLQQGQKNGMSRAQQGIRQAQKTELARKAQHGMKQARKSDLARDAQHRVKQAQHMSQARARQARGYARSAMAH